MTDDIIRSMKEQMVPSDDVVSDLLAKIAACEASPETMDNVDSFESFRGESAAAAVSEKKASQAKKFTTKSIWFYGTAAAASVIVLLSVFSLIGGADPSDIRNVVGGIIDNPNVVATPGDDTDNNTSGNPDDIPAVTDDDGSNNHEDDENGGLLSNLFHKDDKDSDTDKNKGDDNKQNNGNENNNQPSDNDNPNGGNSNVVTPPANEPNPGISNGDSNIVTPPEGDDSKVTPGAPGEADISWDREILAENSVSSITISGSNYVIESVTASPSVASTEVKTISLEIPATSTTNQTTVKAKVKKVKNVSEELMVAVDANGFKDTLLYTNKDYTPATLGQFIGDAGLLADTTFAKSVYCKGEQIGYSSYQRFNVSGIDSLVSKYIFSCENAGPADYSSYRNGNVHVLFKSGKNPTCSVIDFGVSDNGYLYVKMASGNSFTFHIGEKNANGFINSVTGA